MLRSRKATQGVFPRDLTAGGCCSCGPGCPVAACPGGRACFYSHCAAPEGMQKTVVRVLEEPTLIGRSVRPGDIQQGQVPWEEALRKLCVIL